MAIENLPPMKAPKGWQPNSDQQDEIDNDPRLQKMNNDDLYFYFANAKGDAGSARKRPAASSSSPAVPGIGLGAIFSRLNQAMGGK